MPVKGIVVLGVVLLVLLAVAVRDRLQKTHSIVSNFPLVGRFRYWFEELGGPLRQYIVTGSDEERPFSRDQRRWIYASAKKENSYFGFGTDNDLEQATGYVVVRHSAFPLCSPAPGEPGLDGVLPAAKVTPELARACGEVHPALVPLERLEILEGLSSRSAREVFGYEPGWGLPAPAEREAIRQFTAKPAKDRAA